MMLGPYIDTFMARATYRVQEDGSYVGEIAEFDDLEAKGATEEECRLALESALEERVLTMLQFGDELPEP